VREEEGVREGEGGEGVRESEGGRGREGERGREGNPPKHVKRTPIIHFTYEIQISSLVLWQCAFWHAYRLGAIKKIFVIFVAISLLC
jgi:hypothetical protein